MKKYLTKTRARYLPVMPSIIKNDPWWTDKADPHRPAAVDMTVNKPRVPWWMSYHPGYSGVPSEQAAEKAAGRITQIFDRSQM